LAAEAASLLQAIAVREPQAHLRLSAFDPIKAWGCRRSTVGQRTRSAPGRARSANRL